MLKNSSKKNTFGPRPVNEADKVRLRALLEEKRAQPSTSRAVQRSPSPPGSDDSSSSGEEDLQNDPDYGANDEEPGQDEEAVNVDGAGGEADNGGPSALIVRKKKKKALRGGIVFDNSKALVISDKQKRNREAQKRCRAKRKALMEANRKKTLGERKSEAIAKRKRQIDSNPIVRRKDGRKKKVRQWTYEALEEAKSQYLGASDVTDRTREKGTGLRVFAEESGIPRSTLHDAIAHPRRKTVGHPMLFTPEEEEELACVISTFSQFGQAMDKNDVLDLAQGFIRQRREKETLEGREPAPEGSFGLVDDRPGVGWWRGFQKRHTNLKFRVAKSIAATKAELKPEEVSDFYKYFLRATTGVPPENIVNADETAIAFTPERKKVSCSVFVVIHRLVVIAPVLHCAASDTFFSVDFFSSDRR